MMLQISFDTFWQNCIEIIGIIISILLAKRTMQEKIQIPHWCYIILFSLFLLNIVFLFFNQLPGLFHKIYLFALNLEKHRKQLLISCFKSIFPFWSIYYNNQDFWTLFLPAIEIGYIFIICFLINCFDKMDTFKVMVFRIISGIIICYALFVFSGLVVIILINNYTYADTLIIRLLEKSLVVVICIITMYFFTWMYRKISKKIIKK